MGTILVVILMLLKSKPKPVQLCHLTVENNWLLGNLSINLPLLFFLRRLSYDVEGLLI